MQSHLSSLISPISSLVILSSGAGLLTTVLALRLSALGYSDLMVGLLSTAYYGGMMIGAFHCSRYIGSVGHIRTYAAFASVTAVITLTHGLFIDAWSWVIMRLIGGYAMASLYVAIESWVLTLSSEGNRGKVLSIYMIALYGAQAAGQLFLIVSTENDMTFYTIIAILSALSVVPLTLSKIEPPIFQESQHLPFKTLLSTSPSGVFGCFCGGLLLGPLYGLLPIFLKNFVTETSTISFLVSICILGGMGLQYPIGRASDFINRQYVTMLTCVLIIFCSIIVIMLADISLFGLGFCLFLLGGFSFSIYPLSISHTCDYLSNDEYISATQGLLIAYGVGATFGPFLAPLFHHVNSRYDLMIYSMSISMALLLLILARKQVRPAPTIDEQGDYQVIAPPVTPVIAELEDNQETTEANEPEPTN